MPSPRAGSKPPPPTGGPVTVPAETGSSAGVWIIIIGMLTIGSTAMTISRPRPQTAKAGLVTRLDPWISHANDLLYFEKLLLQLKRCPECCAH